MMKMATYYGRRSQFEPARVSNLKKKFNEEDKNKEEKLKITIEINLLSL